MKKIIFLLLILFPAIVFAQEKQNKFGIKFSGFVKNDIFFDSRQTVAVREGHLLLWPAAESPDSDGEDINEKFNFNFLSLQSRLKGSISGPDAFGAKTSGVIEGAFFGSAESGMNNFRLRHAFVKFNWTNTELLVGQYWHAMFITDCFPGTVSFNTGLPFQPFSRNPQIRLTQKSGGVKFIAAAQSQRDFSSRGPAGTTSSYLRNSGIPDMQFQIHYGSKNKESGNSVVTGLGMGYKSILPRLYTEVAANEVKYKTDETVSSLSALVFLKVTTPKITFKLEGVYGENGCDHLSIGGIAEKEVTNASKGSVSYTPIRESSIWTDIHSNGKNFQVGLFAGYTKNLGAKDEITGKIYGLGTDIASLYRVSPRMIFNSGKARFAAEVEYTSAAYGTPNEKAVPKNTTDVGNLRFLLGVYYFF